MRVVAAAILFNNKVLIARRKSGRMKGQWEFPGGKLEPGELDSTALKREINEELGIDIDLGPKIGEFEYKDTEISLVLALYWSFSKQMERKLVDHDLVKWIVPEDIEPSQLAPADVRPAEALKAWVKGQGVPKH